jgi:hypothetical protein
MRRKFLRPSFMPGVLCAIYAIIVVFTASPNLNDEAEAYFNYGRNLLDTGTYGVVAGVPDDFREPGYGFFLAAAIAPARPFLSGQEAMLRWLVLVQASLFACAVFFFFQRAQLPLALRWFTLGVFLLSPTLAGANGAIYSEAIVITLMLVILTALAGPGFPRPRSLAVIGLAASYLLLTKMYLLFLVPIGAAAFLVAAVRMKGAGLGREAAMRLLVVTVLVSLPFLAWSARGRGLEKRHKHNDRIIIQLAGKVYRHKQWNLREEWKPALLASCCASTCLNRYGAGTCNKFTWITSDPLGYQVLQEWIDRPPEQKKKSVLRETLEYWWSTLPIQIVSSGLELVRIAFFEGASVSPESGFLWRKFAQLWHFFGSLLVWAIALAGMFLAWKERKTDSFIRRASIGGGALIVYHLVFMSQVTNVQRYSVPLLPWFYWFASLALWRLFLAAKASKLRTTIRKAQSK